MALQLFHKIIAEWFKQKYGQPTPIQAQAWPEIARGGHVLVSAPTGSGKTLTGFLWFINQLIDKPVSQGHKPRLLYISPLKALNNDIEKNLREPLAELKELFLAQGHNFPDIEIGVRSGDTPPYERQKMLRHPPDILITTPESLSILLTSLRGRNLLPHIEAVIIDEVHAIYHNKRGAYLAVALERLGRLAGEFQRLAISATLTQESGVKDFVAGFEREGEELQARKIKKIFSQSNKQYLIRVHSALNANSEESEESDVWWSHAIEKLHAAIKQNNSTLVFTNSRRHAEKVSRLLNEKEAHLAYAHHGSLSKEVRLAVEEKLKQGELKAIVATSSLELGIDIGALDEVILFSAAMTTSSAIQRVGRAGHQVGATSRARLYALHGSDYLHCAVQADLIDSRQIETRRPMQNCLDLLSQTLLSMGVAESWQLDDAFELLRQSYTFHNLERTHFDSVIEMLAGRYAESQVYELKARIYLDRIKGEYTARRGVDRLLYHSGGTIVDRGYLDLVIAQTHQKIGELDEEFVFERAAGDTFPLGNRTWRILAIDNQKVEVEETIEGPVVIPFWRAENTNRDFFFSQAITRALAQMNKELSGSQPPRRWQQDFFVDQEAADLLFNYLKNQKVHTGCDLPSTNNLVIEHTVDKLLSKEFNQVIIHTLWGGALNRPLAMAIKASWQNEIKLQAIADDDCILLLAPVDIDARSLLLSITPENMLGHLRKTLEQTGLFGAYFRENAYRSLLIPRPGFGKRTPLWVSRMRSKKLYAKLKKYPDFPVTAETWRTILQDVFDLDNLNRQLEALQAGQINITEVKTESPSPFASGILWDRTNEYMYADDAAEESHGSNITRDLINQLAPEGGLAPRVSNEINVEYRSKKQRVFKDYAIETLAELVQLLKERQLLNESQWLQLIESLDKEQWVSWQEKLAEQVVTVKLETQVYYMHLETAAVFAENGWFKVNRVEQLGGRPLALQDLPRLQLEMSTHEMLLRYLSFMGLVNLAELEGFLNNFDIEIALNDLLEAETLIQGALISDDEDQYIGLVDDYEAMLRIQRSRARQSSQKITLSGLTFLRARLHGLPERALDQSAVDPYDLLQQTLERLFGYEATASLWEDEILHARIAHYQGLYLDHLLARNDLRWQATGPKKVFFYHALDARLLQRPSEKEIGQVLPAPRGRFSYEDILSNTELDITGLNTALAAEVTAGLLSADSFDFFRNKAGPGAEAMPARQAFNQSKRWKKQHSGYWFTLAEQTEEESALDSLENDKERVRILLARHGILNRTLLQKERLQWSKLFKAMTLMELSGEILGGYFVEGLPGLQFASKEAVSVMNQTEEEQTIFWLNAQDPLSLCGLGLDLPHLPRRLPGNHLIYDGPELVLVSEKNGRQLNIHVSPEHAMLEQYLDILLQTFSKRRNPPTIETINGETISTSPYLSAFKAAGFRKKYRGYAIASNKAPQAF